MSANLNDRLILKRYQCFNLMTGFISGVGKGFMRSFYINSELVGDIIPVEYPINLMIAVAWHTALQK